MPGVPPRYLFDMTLVVHGRRQVTEAAPRNTCEMMSASNQRASGNVVAEHHTAKERP